MHIFHLKKKKNSTSLKKYIQLLSNLTHEKESMQTALTNRINKHIPRTPVHLAQHRERNHLFLSPLTSSQT